MSEGGYKITNPEGIYFVSFAVVEWVDVFTRRDYKDILVNSLKFCQEEKHLLLHGWCIMTNHVHFIASSGTGQLSAILRDFKRFTSVEVVKAIQNNNHESRKDWMLPIFRKAGIENSHNIVNQFWQQDNQPKECYLHDFTKQKLDYVHNNPVVEGYVDCAEDYVYSSARSYAGRPGLLKVELLW
jgi:REP element-mobilizing transposase RayT